MSFVPPWSFAAALALVAVSPSCCAALPVPTVGQARVALQRDVCWNDPAYRVSLDDAGHVEYFGFAYVGTTGHVRYDIDPTAVAQLLKRIDVLPFDELVGAHVQSISDVPDDWIEVVRGDDVRRASWRWSGTTRGVFAPKCDPTPFVLLDALAAEIDRVAGVETWTDPCNEHDFVPPGLSFDARDAAEFMDRFR